MFHRAYSGGVAAAFDGSLHIVTHQLNPLERHDPVVNHAAKMRQKSINLFFFIDDLYHDWQILAQTQQTRGSNASARAEPHDSPEDRCAGEPVLLRFVDNLLIDGSAPLAVALTVINPQLNRVDGGMHRINLRRNAGPP